MHTQWNDVGLEVIEVLTGNYWINSITQQKSKNTNNGEFVFVLMNTRCEVFYEFGTWRKQNQAKQKQSMQQRSFFSVESSR